MAVYQEGPSWLKMHIFSHLYNLELTPRFFPWKRPEAENFLVLSSTMLIPFPPGFCLDHIILPWNSTEWLYTGLLLMSLASMYGLHQYHIASPWGSTKWFSIGIALDWIWHQRVPWPLSGTTVPATTSHAPHSTMLPLAPLPLSLSVNGQIKGAHHKCWYPMLKTLTPPTWFTKTLRSWIWDNNGGLYVPAVKGACLCSCAAFLPPLGSTYATLSPSEQHIFVCHRYWPWTVDDTYNCIVKQINIWTGI